jgi:hypothetical protein
MGNKKWLTLIFYDFRRMKKTFHKVIREANANFILCALCFELCSLCFALCFKSPNTPDPPEHQRP